MAKKDYGTTGNRPVKAGGKWNVAGTADYLAQHGGNPRKVKAAISAQEQVGKVMSEYEKHKNNKNYGNDKGTVD